MRKTSKLRVIRESKGYNTLDVALEVGCCQRTIYKIEHGDIDSTVMSIVKAYSDVLGLTLDEVWELGKV